MKRILAILLSVLFCMFMFPARQTQADTREEITYVTACSNIAEIAVYGTVLRSPTFEIIYGEPANMNAAVIWEKNVDGVWTAQNSGTFTVGTWRFRTQIRIDGDYGLTHTFGNEVMVYLDADPCTVTDINRTDSYSSCFIISPEYKVGLPVLETAVQIDPPRIGQYPSYTTVIPAGMTYCVDPSSNGAWKDSILWRDITDDRDLTPGAETFLEGHRYMVMITLTPIEGYQFSYLCTATVNGREAGVNILFARNELIVTYAFDTLRTGWYQTSTGWYYYDETGALAVGWKQIGGKWYYFNASGVMQTGWQKIGGKWYYFNTSGAMQIGWQKIGGKWYYFNTSGAMQTSWQKIGGKWYYFNAGGDMVTGWKKIGKWYYFNASGVMQTGWQQIGGKWYYFNAGGDMVTGWLKLGTNWYYLDSNGVMVTGTKVINGKTYKFNSSGVCLNP